MGKIDCDLLIISAHKKHGYFMESRKSRRTKNMRKIIVFLSYLSIVWNILIDILVFSQQLQLNFYRIGT